jgi:hypothetical protein
MEQRTHGKLHITRHADRRAIYDEDEVRMARTAKHGDRNEADARYLVASWNACTAAGLSVEDLENGAVEKLVEAAKEMVSAAYTQEESAGRMIHLADVLSGALAALDKEVT